MTEYHLLIGGELVPGAASMPVINPADEQVLAQSPRASLDQLNAAVAAAKSAHPLWAKLPIAERKTTILAIAAAIEANVDTLAPLLTREQGKPLAEARREVMGMAAFFRFVTSLDLPVDISVDKMGRRIERRRLSLGVVAAIIPWNFPLLTIAFKVPFALLAGNTVIIKPAPTTPLSTLYFGKIVAAIVPPGVINVIADANDLGGALTSHPDVRKVSFTGSTATGRKVMTGAAGTLKRLTLELGGNDAAIVLPDVDVKAVAPKIFRAAFHNSGQVCLAIKRLYVHDGVYDALCDELTALAREAVLGDGLEEGTQFGPVQNRIQFEKVMELIEDARHHGVVAAGGQRLNRPGYFIPPTIVRDIKDGTRLVDEEQFGPVLPIIRFSEIGDVVNRANGLEFGLGASVWGSDWSAAREVAGQLDSGTVWINKHADLSPGIPFGGSKASGIGTEFAQEGLLEFTQLQIISGGASEAA